MSTKKSGVGSALGLLDDAALRAPATTSADHAWEDLTRVKCRVPKVIPTLNVPTPAKAAPLRPQNKVFSSTPTLRQMMQEYNRPTATTTPIKVSAPRASSDFRFDRVDLIQIPLIPGKILRPTRMPDAES